MTRLHYSRPHNLSRLHDELLASGIRPLLVEGDGAELWLTLADDVAITLVDTIVAAHDPTPAPPPPDPDVELALAIDSATTLAELKAALLGKTRPGKAAGRPVT